MQAIPERSPNPDPAIPEYCEMPIWNSDCFNGVHQVLRQANQRYRSQINGKQDMSAEAVEGPISEKLNHNRTHEVLECEWFLGKTFGCGTSVMRDEEVTASCPNGRSDVGKGGKGGYRILSSCRFGMKWTMKPRFRVGPYSFFVKLNQLKLVFIGNHRISTVTLKNWTVTVQQNCCYFPSELWFQWPSYETLHRKIIPDCEKKLKKSYGKCWIAQKLWPWTPIFGRVKGCVDIWDSQCIS